MAPGHRYALPRRPARMCEIHYLNQSSDENHMHYATNYVGFTCAPV